MIRLAIIDDTPDNLEVFGIYLTKTAPDMVVTTFPSGEQFLSTFTPKSFDLLLVDISLPGMDGYELLRQVRAVDGVTPALAFTVHAFPHDLKKALAAGFCDVITKPVIDFDKFSEIVRNRARKEP